MFETFPFPFDVARRHHTWVVIDTRTDKVAASFGSDDSWRPMAQDKAAALNAAAACQHFDVSRPTADRPTFRCNVCGQDI